ncbi:hypothetical protein SD340_003645 [Vibrio fluvialis]|uniref:hypothetical protein n=1 Tax=Vibrio TaxID=662 RepID=UPI000648D73E|nr:MULTISPECIES: hypothetical protein [Vibrio]EKO3371262.1 hypothetical protein [Vibrio fluvialis]EKO3378370.1 hypothetical protein [Vibrio fluvialis]EKO3388724.1 hypothetical protein [Vibrio fluvialis]EKO3399248.1 hypothetical protein [Vibrio fluvialis]EKO3413246.1 hypothetical protein [Vibrio fluvialis]
MHDWYEKITNYIVYLMSGAGVVLGMLSFEQWVSIVIGVIALIANIWHKRAMQTIAREKGIYINEDG